MGWCDMAIRISNLSIQRQLIDDINRNQKTVQDLQLKLSTGLNINTPSDDPVGLLNALKLKTSISEGNQYQKNIDDGSSKLSATINILSSIESLVLDIMGIASDAVNSTSSASHGVTAQEIDGMLNEIYLHANAKFLGKYVFGGTETTTKPYTESIVSGNTVLIQRTAVANSVESFKGIDGKIYATVAEGLDYQINISGSAPFIPNGEGGVNDLFDTLIKLRDSIHDHDSATTISLLEDLDNEYENVVTQTTLLGGRLNRLQKVKATNRDLGIFKEENLSDVLNVDHVKAISDLNYQQFILQMSLQVGSKMIAPSLMDYI